MAEGAGIEIGPDLPIDHTQDISIELRRDPLTVVIGSFEDRRVLDEVDTEQQPILAVQQSPELQEKFMSGPGFQVANRTTQEGNQPAAGRGRNMIQMALEVAEDGVHIEERICPHQALHCTVDHLRVEVLETALYKALEAARPPAEGREAEVFALRRELAALEAETSRLAVAIAEGGELRALVEQLRQRASLRSLLE